MLALKVLLNAVPTPLRWGLGLAFVLCASTWLGHGLHAFWLQAGSLFSILLIWTVTSKIKQSQWLIVHFFSVYPIILLAFVVAAAWLDGSWAHSFRLDLIFGNPNLLAASLVTAMLAAIGFYPHPARVQVIGSQLAGLAVLVGTASRTGLVALVIGYAVFGLVRLVASADRTRLVSRKHLSVAVVIGALLIASGFLSTVATGARKNLLTLSGDFGHSAWRIAEGSTIQEIEHGHRDPRGKLGATRVMGTSNGAGVIFHQSLGRSQLDSPYVASIYLRADRPQQIKLSTNLNEGSIICSAIEVWSRCATPVSIGNNQSNVQFRISTVELAAPFNIYLWGAQLEASLAPTRVEIRSIWAWRIARLFLYDSGTITASTMRLEAWSIAGKVFLESPWIGVGPGRTREACLAKTNGDYECYDHAHNLPLHLLAEGGIIGLLICLLPISGGLASLGIEARRRAAPLLAGLACLNFLDVSYYHAGVFYLAWACFSVLAADDRHLNK